MAEHVEMVSEDLERVVCPWCSFYSVAATSCEHCGSPIPPGRPVLLRLPHPA